VPCDYVTLDTILGTSCYSIVYIYFLAYIESLRIVNKFLTTDSVIIILVSVRAYVSPCH